jgi:nitrite reductase/ring-hydroxylating ferredoxin subunit
VAHPVDAAGHPIVLVRLKNRVYAVDGWCPHRMGPMTEGKVEGYSLRCPWHGFKYDFRTGRLTWPVRWDPIPTYRTRITADEIVEVAVEFDS